MTNVFLKAKAKSYQEVWQKDKELLSPVMQLEGDMPTSEGVKKIFIAKQKRWQTPEEPFELTQSSLEKVLDGLVPDLISVCGCEIPEMPVMQICEFENYLPRIQEMDRELNKKMGYGEICASPPTMGSFPFFRKIVMPRKFIVRIPKTKDVTSLSSNQFESVEYEWDKAFFEQVLFGQFAFALFRQVRGEWGEDYIRAIKKIGPANQSMAFFVYNSSLQFAKEQVANKRGWNLYVVEEKIGVAWQSREGMECYRAIDALSNVKKLADICKADQLYPTPTEVAATFCLQHPRSAAKYRDFCNSVKN